MPMKSKGQAKVGKVMREFADVKNALRRGEIVKPTVCESCGQEVFLTAHHHDYSKPLAITWLCRPCHRIADAQLKMEQKIVSGLEARNDLR
jgi:ribosomal protein S27AE